MIYGLGDSHVMIITAHPQLTHKYIPFENTALFSNFSATVSNEVQNIIKTSFNPATDYILFCFAEIDLRAHVAKKCTATGKLDLNMMEKEVDFVITQYLQTIEYYYELLNKKLIIFLPTASTHSKPREWVYGTNLERNIITKNFNDKLSKLLQEKNILFISIFEEMVDENLNTIQLTLENDCPVDDLAIHASKPIMQPIIIHKLKNLGVIE